MKRTLTMIVAALLALSLTTALADAAGPWPGFDDVPAIPEDFAALIPGIPASIDDLSGDIDVDTLIAMCAQWDGACQEALVNDGEVTLDAMGYEWKHCEMSYLDAEGNEERAEWEVATEDDAVTIALPDELQGIAVDDVQYFLLWSPDNFILEVYGFEGEGEFASTMMYLDVDDSAAPDDAYYSIAYAPYDADVGAYVIEADADGQIWVGEYDENGKLVNVEYYT